MLTDKAIVLLEVFVRLIFSFNLLPLLIPMLSGFQFSLIPLVDTSGVLSTIVWKRRVSVRSCVLLMLRVIHRYAHRYTNV